MRSRLLRGGALPALAALVLFGHPPASASPLLRSTICGSGAVVTIPLKGAPRSGDEKSSYAACHAACSVRKRLHPGDKA